jgi:hypothetical protein
LYFAEKERGSDMSEKEIRVGVDKPNNHMIYAATIGSIVLSVTLLKRNPTLSNFVGLWAPTILGLGILWKENELLERTKALPAM